MYRREKIRTLIIAIAILLGTSLISVYILLNSSSASILKSFNIKKIDIAYRTFTVEYEKVPAAKYYKIEIIDNTGRRNKLYTKETQNTKETFELQNMENGIEYSLMVYAYDARGDYRPANEEKLFTWNEVTFDDNEILLHDEDKVLGISGDIKNKSYEISILDNGEEKQKYKLESNEITIPKDLFVGKETTITANILVDGVVIDEIHLYSNINPITDIKITQPLNGRTIPYADFALSYEGLDNVDNRIVNIYDENGKLLKSASMKKNIAILSKELFTPNKKYIIEVEGSLEETYSKKGSVEVVISDQINTQPVYINKKPK